MPVGQTGYHSAVICVEHKQSTSQEAIQQILKVNGRLERHPPLFKVVFFGAKSFSRFKRLGPPRGVLDGTGMASEALFCVRDPRRGAYPLRGAHEAGDLVAVFGLINAAG